MTAPATASALTPDQQAVGKLISSWQGPDLTLRQMCACKHNLSQHSFSRGPCDYRDYRNGCGCSRFTRDEAAR